MQPQPQQPTIILAKEKKEETKLDLVILDLAKTVKTEHLLTTEEN